MEKTKFLQQVYRKITDNGISGGKLRDDCIEIFEDDKVIFKIDGKGGMFYSSDKHLSGIIDTLHDKIQPIVCEVDEYLTVMENGTELKARDFNMSYTKLAEFNEVVLAGTEHSNGTFEFATWDYRKNSLYHGHYYTDYNSAKKDFATRSGLIPEQLVFNNRELVEIYRCIEDTLGNEYELTDGQTSMLEGVQDRIKNSVVNFDELLREAIDQNEEQGMQGMTGM